MEVEAMAKTTEDSHQVRMMTLSLLANTNAMDQ